MGSTRFPGKVLVPFKGRPIIDHVVSRIAKAVPSERITVATSTEPSDDPLAAHLGSTGVSVFRGPLDDVLGRFQMCLEQFPCRWVVRVSADSPLFDPQVLESMLSHVDRDNLDVITNLFPRTFPKGNSVEIVRSSVLAEIDSSSLRADLKEHVTLVLYEESSRYRIKNIESEHGDLTHLNLCVDTIDDLARLEDFQKQEETAAGGVSA